MEVRLGPWVPTVEHGSSRLTRRQAFTQEATMSDPKDQQQADELELDAETVKDLEAKDEDAEQVRGGNTHTCACQGTQQV